MRVTSLPLKTSRIPRCLNRRGAVTAGRQSTGRSPAMYPHPRKLRSVETYVVGFQEDAHRRTDEPNTTGTATGAQPLGHIRASFRTSDVPRQRDPAPLEIDSQAQPLAHMLSNGRGQIPELNQPLADQINAALV